MRLSIGAVLPRHAHHFAHISSPKRIAGRRSDIFYGQELQTWKTATNTMHTSLLVYLQGYEAMELWASALLVSIHQLGSGP